MSPGDYCYGSTATATATATAGARVAGSSHASPDSVTVVSVLVVSDDDDDYFDGRVLDGYPRTTYGDGYDVCPGSRSDDGGDRGASGLRMVVI